jgi:hypothetical protein
MIAGEINSARGYVVSVIPTGVNVGVAQVISDWAKWRSPVVSVHHAKDVGRGGVHKHNPNQFMDILVIMRIGNPSIWHRSYRICGMIKIKHNIISVGPIFRNQMLL